MKQMPIVNNANVHRVTKGSDMTEQLNNNSRLEEIRIMFLYFLWRYYQDTLLVKSKKKIESKLYKGIDIMIHFVQPMCFYIYYVYDLIYI